MKTQTRNDEILGLFQEGLTLAGIGDQFGITRERVRQIVAGRGAIPRMDMIQERHRNAAKMVVESDSRISIKSAASSHDTTAESVRRAIVEGYPEYDHKAARRARVVEVHKARLDGIGEHTCPVCGQTKGWGEFPRNTVRGMPSRRPSCCTACNSEQHRDWYSRNKTRNPTPTVADKECTRCGLTKLASEMTVNKSGRDGLGSWCRRCHNGWRSSQC